MRITIVTTTQHNIGSFTMNRMTENNTRTLTPVCLPYVNGLGQAF